MTHPTLRRRSFHPAASLLLLAAGCSMVKDNSLERQDRDALRLLMPRSVLIVKPFTTWADFDGQPGVDGIDVYVQPVNDAGDPIQAAGAMFVELYTFRQASADHRGDRLGIWDFTLRTQADQDRYWRRAVQMYEFPILLPPPAQSAGPATQFVLTVTHNPPVGDRRFDEYILETPLATGALSEPRQR